MNPMKETLFVIATMLVSVVAYGAEKPSQADFVMSWFSGNWNSRGLVLVN